MTTRQRFERWARRHELMLDRSQEVTRNGPHWVYMHPMTEAAWQAWHAATRAKT